MGKILNTTALILNILAALALLLSYFSTYISPERFWPLAFFGLTYPILLAINILFILFWLIKWDRRILISVLILVLGFNHIFSILPNPMHRGIIGESGPEATVKVLSYNVRAFNIYEWLKDPNTDRGINNFIRSENPDIICLQEFFTIKDDRFSPHAYDRLFTNVPHHHVEYSIPHSRHSGFGIATFSRYPIIHQKTIRFKNSTNICIYSDILFEEDTVRVFNCHLQSVQFKANNYAFLDSLNLGYSDQQLRELQDLSGKLKDAYRMRAAQAELVRAEIKNSPHPVLVCGDFNDTPVSYAYRTVRRGLKDSWMESGRDWGNTYLGRLSFRIDYILYSSEFESVAFEKVKTKLSDHYPIVSYLRMGKKD